jgi:glycyl-tRNA synthetase
MNSKDKYEGISELARRRGFFWPSGEIYGGTSGFINWGPLGAIMKRKIEDKFRELFLIRLGLYELESPIIMPESVFKSSGHLKNFKEPMIKCLKCNKKFRADHLLQEFANFNSKETDKLDLKEVKVEIEKNDIKCPFCEGPLGEPAYFLTMFKTAIGPYSDYIGYGRPEAAQTIFVEFKRLYEINRKKLPVGFATIGHALRNEISPRQGPIRLREFTIIDLEFFFDPDYPKCPLINEVANQKLKIIPAENRLKGQETPLEITVKKALKKGYIKMEWQAFFMALSKNFLLNLGVPEDKQLFIEKLSWERAHYSVQGFDQEVYLDRWGWTEVAGFNYRTDYDLKCHMQGSGVDLKIFKENNKKRKTIETLIKPKTEKIGPTFKDKTSQVLFLLKKTDPKMIERSFQTKGFFMIEKFKILPKHVEIIHKEKEVTGRRFIPHVIEPSFGSDRLAYITLEHAYITKNNRTILKLPREIAPIQIAVLPLVSKNNLPKKAKELHTILIREGFNTEYDETGSIGKRYARFDEIGTPLCITVDYQTLEDKTVTIRDRDSWKQVRTNISKLTKCLFDYFKYKTDFKNLGFSI